MQEMDGDAPAGRGAADRLGQAAGFLGVSDAAGRSAAGGAVEGSALSAPRPVVRRKDVVAAFLRCERGATAIEYSLIVGLIFLAIVAAVRNYTASTSDMYSMITSALP